MSEYMNIVKQVVEILPTNASVKDRVGSVESSVKHLKELVASIQEQARLSISFLKMQVSVNVLGKTSEPKKRLNMVHLCFK